jgi:hypothetical protein
VGTIAWFTLRGRGRIILRAKWDALIGIRRAWRKRRVIQARRQVSLQYVAGLLAHGTLNAWRGR